MIRNFKVLGLALVAVFAMSAMAAASASAAENFMSEGNVTTKISADQEESNQHVFTVDGATVKCTTAHFETPGEETSPTTTLTVVPKYENCTAFGFLNATVTVNNCHYKLTRNGTLHIVVTSGTCSIIIKGGTCEVTVGAQENLKSVSYENIAGGKVRIKANVSGIAVNKLADGFLCPLSGTGAGTGTYTGNTIASGTHEGKAVNITVE